MRLQRQDFVFFAKNAFDRPLHLCKALQTALRFTAIFILVSTLSLCAPSTKATEAERKPGSDFHELWQSRLPDQSDSPMIDLLEAVSSKRSGAQTRDLLKGVIKITRTNESVEFDRIDGAALVWHKDTGDGARFFSDWEESAAKIEKQVGESGANYLRSLRSIEAKGDKIEVFADEGHCSLPFQKEQKGFLKLKALHLSKLSLTLKKEKDVIWIKRLDGVEALLSAGIAEVPIQLREFCRRKNEKGDTVLTFGLSTPFLSPLRALLIVPDAFRISFTIRKGSTPQS